MDIFNESLTIDTTEKIDFIDVTDDVRNIVSKLNIKEGVVNLFTTHTTTAIRINENEPRLIEDLKFFLEKHCPKYGKYFHDDIEERDVNEEEPKNAHSHLKSFILGTSESIPIINSELRLGQWQSIFFVDLDGPRRRNLSVNILGVKNGYKANSKKAQRKNRR